MLGGVVFTAVLLSVVSMLLSTPILSQDNSYSSKNLQTANEFQLLEQPYSLTELFDNSEFGNIA